MILNTGIYWIDAIGTPVLWLVVIYVVASFAARRQIDKGER